MSKIQTVWAKRKAATPVLLVAICRSSLSVSNFIITILLARELTKEEFGTYVILNSLIIFSDLITNPFLLGPAMVLGPKMDQSKIAGYLTFLFTGQQITSLIIGGIYFITGLMLFNLNPQLLVVYIIALILLRTQNYFYLIQIMRFNLFKASVNVLLLGLCKLSGVLILIYAGISEISLMGIFVIFSIGGLITSLFGALTSGQILSSKIGWSEYLKENWIFGKWQFVGALSSFGYSRGYIFIIGSLLGSGSVALVEASINLVRPANLLIDSISNVLISKSSSILKKHGIQHLRKRLDQLSWVILISILSFAILIVSFTHPILDLVYDGKYSTPVNVWCSRLAAVGILFVGLRVPLKILYFSIERPKVDSYSLLLSFIVALILMPLLINFYDVLGAVVAMITSNILAYVFLKIIGKRATYRVQD